MPTLEELETRVEQLEKTLEKEVSKSNAAEKDLQLLREELMSLKLELEIGKEAQPKEETSSDVNTVVQKDINLNETKSQPEDNKSLSSYDMKSRNSIENDDDSEEVIDIAGSSSSDEEAPSAGKEENKKKNSSEEGSRASLENSSKEQISKNRGTKKVVTTTELSKKNNNNQPQALTGYLEKKGAVRHNWLKRWFVLDPTTHVLSYYNHEGDKEAKGHIPLINAICYAKVEKKGILKPLFFNIRTEKRDFLLQAMNREEKERWVRAIKSNCIKGVLTSEHKKMLTKRGSTFIGKAVED